VGHFKTDRKVGHPIDHLAFIFGKEENGILSLSKETKRIGSASELLGQFD
jgi:hypothetical protein